MSYFLPKIDQAGLETPTYQDLEDFQVSEARRIFGQDIFLGSDSQRFQQIASLALSQYDFLQALQLAYNARSVVSATGVALDQLVANNGLVRMPATKSLVTITLSGTAFTVINNGVVSDSLGNVWILPASVTIGSTGSVSVTATAQESGPISAAPGTITRIQTPTAGWVSVTNPNPASVGTDIETDGALKSRQAVATAGPTQAITTGILGAIQNLPQVSQVQLYENDTNSSVTSLNGVTNPAGFPPHSLTLVVLGGDDNDIALTYANRKTPGAFTNGATSVNVTDQKGVISTIRFYRPTDQPLDLTVTIKTLPGYSNSVRDAGKLALSQYVNNLPTGSSIIISELFQALSNSDNDNTMSIKLITVGNHNGSQFNNDAPLNFNRNPVLPVDNITWLVQ